MGRALPHVDRLPTLLAHVYSRNEKPAVGPQTPTAGNPTRAKSNSWALQHRSDDLILSLQRSQDMSIRLRILPFALLFSQGVLYAQEPLCQPFGCAPQLGIRIFSHEYELQQTPFQPQQELVWRTLPFEPTPAYFPAQQFPDQFQIPYVDPRPEVTYSIRRP